MAKRMFLSVAFVSIGILVAGSIPARGQIGEIWEVIKDLAGEAIAQSQLPQAVQDLAQAQLNLRSQLSETQGNLGGRIGALEQRLRALRDDHQRQINARAYQDEVATNRNAIGTLEAKMQEVQNDWSSFSARAALDAIPRGSVVAFQLAQCPDGWNMFREVAGRMILGAGVGNGLTRRHLGERGGTERHSLSIAELPSHSHYLTNLRKAYEEAESADGFQRGPAFSDGANPGRIWVAGSPIRTKQFTNSVGNGAAHENMPPFYTLLYCRKG